jgi:hypothetical protein
MKWHVCARPVPDPHIELTIQEYSYPDVAPAVMRYFNSSTFRKEWIDRRVRLLNAWTCPILILQGYHSRTQPRECYENPRQFIPTPGIFASATLTRATFGQSKMPRKQSSSSGIF